MVANWYFSVAASMGMFSECFIDGRRFVAFIYIYLSFSPMAAILRFLCA